MRAVAQSEHPVSGRQVGVAPDTRAPLVVIISDPPWRYAFSRSRSRRIENQYATLAVPEIMEARRVLVELTRSVRLWGEVYSDPPPAILYLWATAPKLPEALAVMSSWDFEYKTHLVWDKVRVGMGYWARGRHELVLVGTRGDASPPAPALRLPSIVREKRGAHSVKPDWLHEHVEKAFPQARKIELFARRPRAGWTVWGDEVGGVGGVAEEARS